MSLRRGIEPVERLKRSLAKVNEWASGMSTQADSRDSQDQLARYIAHDTTVSFAQGFSHLEEKGSAYLGQSLLLAPTDQNKAIQLFRQAARYKTIVLGLEALLLKRRQKTTFIDLKRLTSTLLRALGTGQINLVEHQFRLLYDGFIHGYGFYTEASGTDNWRYAAMAFSIFGDAFGMEVDLDALKLTRDPAWMPLVQSWDTDDLDLIQSVLLEACDLHLSRIGLFGVEFDSGQFEFSSPFLGTHPTEILAILRLRESRGLINPALDHPLMATPYAKLTCGADVPVEPDPLLDAFFKAIAERDPDIMAGWNAVMTN